MKPPKYKEPKDGLAVSVALVLENGSESLLANFFSQDDAHAFARARRNKLEKFYRAHPETLGVKYRAVRVRCLLSGKLMTEYDKILPEVRP